jgi:hypothetical protein
VRDDCILVDELLETKLKTRFWARLFGGIEAFLMLAAENNGRFVANIVNRKNRTGYD